MTFIETGTVDHVLCIEAEKEDFVTITEYQGSCKHGKYDSLRQRIKLAWRALRGEGLVWVEFYSPEGVDKLVAELTRAREVAFGQAETRTLDTQELQYRLDLLQGWKEEHLKDCPGFVGSPFLP